MISCKYVEHTERGDFCTGKFEACSCLDQSSVPECEEVTDFYLKEVESECEVSQPQSP